MKKLFSTALLAVSVIAANAQFNAAKTPFLTQSLSSKNIDEVYSETSGGNISVTGVAASEARVEVYAVPNGREDRLSEAEIKERINADYDLKVDVSGTKLTASARSKHRLLNWKKGLSISFKIYVPKNITTDLNTSGGNIDLKNLSGRLKFETSGGNLDIDDVAGNIDGRTSGGNINVNHATDHVELTTSGGNIEARNCDGMVQLTTSGGDLRLYDLKGTIKASTSGGNVAGKNIGGELRAGTSGGNVDLTELTCSLEASTSGGNIKVDIKETGKYIRITNSGGNVDLDLPKSGGADLDLSAERIKTDHLDNFSGKIEDERVEGKLNGGGVPVTVRASSGHIHVGLK
ncbi:MAG: DUF4097 family beta strand repeat-containing protein [Ferruginibacter sp.]